MIAESMNLLGTVASSPLFARLRQERSPHELRRSLLDSLGRFLQFISTLRGSPPGAGRQPLLNAELPLQEMQRRVVQWNPTEEPGLSLTEQARECLAALGVPPPEGGWDALTEVDSPT
jgi:hypothetical protein